MKKLLLAILVLAVCSSALAQHRSGMPPRQKKATTKYQTIIYTDPSLKEAIAQQAQLENERTRGVGKNITAAFADALVTSTTGTVSTLVDMGVNVVSQLATRKQRMKKDWEATVKKESSFTMPISTVADISDFYSAPSMGSALDPANMTFDGIGCSSIEGTDTALLFSCHINRDRLDRIIRHSKFELTLDTLIIAPKEGNLPNTSLDIPFTFADRGQFHFAIKIKIFSSWINDITTVYTDQQLGEFVVNITVDSTMIDKDGKFRYIRRQGESPAYQMVGESFIVPRSYMPIRDAKGDLFDCWGTGQYRLQLDLMESCDITPAYRNNWKEDYRRRTAMMKEHGDAPNVIELSSSMRFDNITKQWIINTIKTTATGTTRTSVKDATGATGATTSFGKSGGGSDSGSGSKSNKSDKK